MKARILPPIICCLIVLVGRDCLAAPVPQAPPPKECATLKGHKNTVLDLAFSPDGKVLASASADKTIRLWNVAKGKEIAPLSDHTDWVIAVAFSPDGKLLASTSRDRSIRLWDGINGKLIAVLAERWGATPNIVFSPDNKTLAACTKATFWDLRSKKISRICKEPRISVERGPHCLVYDSEGKLIGLVDDAKDREVTVWDVLAGKPLRILKYPKEGAFGGARAFSPDRKLLAAGDWDLCVWDIPSGKLLGNYELVPRTKRPAGHITSLAFSPDGKLLAVAWQGFPQDPTRDRTVLLLDPTTGKVLGTLDGCRRTITCVAFSPDGRMLAASEDQTIKLWDVRGVKAPKKER